MKRSRFFLKIAGYLFLIFTAIHSIAHLSDPSSRLQNDEDRRVWQLIQTHEFSIDGSKVSFGRLQTGFDWFLMILLLSSGIQILIIARAGDTRLIKLFAGMYLVMMGALIIITRGLHQISAANDPLRFDLGNAADQFSVACRCGIIRRLTTNRR